MSIDWFSPSQRRRSANDTIKPSYNGSVPEDNETGRPSMQRAITAPLSTPHDAVLSVFSMLSGAPRDADGDVSNSNGQRNPTSISAVPMTRDTSGEDASTQEPGSIQGIRTAAATPSAAPNPFSGGVEHVYDPFTGNMAGVLYPRPPDQSTSSSANDTESKKKDSLQFDQAKDDLWSHLARIRDLQSEIASMHGNMEGIGLNDGGRSGQKRPAHPTTRMHTDTIGAGEEWVDAEQEAKEREKARDAEFVKLAESFEGRRGAIDGIVNKLDDLSKALTTFHSLPTPQIGMLFRSTRDTAASPVLRSPSPMFTNPASSPPPGSPPMSPVSTTSDYGRRSKPMGTRGMAMDGLRTDFHMRALSPMSESPVSDDGKL